MSISSTAVTNLIAPYPDDHPEMQFARDDHPEMQFARDSRAWMLTTKSDLQDLYDLSEVIVRVQCIMWTRIRNETGEIIDPAFSRSKYIQHMRLRGGARASDPQYLYDACHASLHAEVRGKIRSVIGNRYYNNKVIRYTIKGVVEGESKKPASFCRTIKSLSSHPDVTDEELESWFKSRRFRWVVNETTANLVSNILMTWPQEELVTRSRTSDLAPISDESQPWDQVEDRPLTPSSSDEVTYEIDYDYSDDDGSIDLSNNECRYNDLLSYADNEATASVTSDETETSFQTI